MSTHSFGYEMAKVAQNYMKYRPTYTTEIYEKILTYLDKDSREPDGRRGLVIDVGCGTGNSTVPLVKYFQRVIGIDSSAAQINMAKQFNAGHPNIVYEVRSAEDMNGIVTDESVDLVTAGMALHWFDEKKFSHECLRVLKLGGVLATYSLKSPQLENQEADKHYKQIIIEVMKKYVEVSLHPVYDGWPNTCAQLSQFLHQAVRDDSICLKLPYSITDMVGFIISTPQYYRYKADYPDHPDEIDLLIQKLKVVYATESVNNKVDHCFYPISLVMGRKL